MFLNAQIIIANFIICKHVRWNVKKYVYYANKIL